MQQLIIQCFGCFKSSVREYHGATYNTHEIEQEFFDVYQKIGKPDIKCSTCKKEVFYQKLEDGKWEEILIERLPF